MQGLSLYDQFQDFLNSSSLDELERFCHEPFWEECGLVERHEMAMHLLKKGELLLNRRDHPDMREDNLRILLTLAEKIDASPSILIASGALYFKLAHLDQKTSLYIKAIDKLSRARSKGELPSAGIHLWGNSLVALGFAQKEPLFISEAIEKYKMGEKLLLASDYDPLLEKLYWDWGVALTLLGDLSEEQSDYHEALAIFEKGVKLGASAPQFFIDYGIAFSALGTLEGNPDNLRAALSLFKKVISTTPDPESLVLKTAWKEAALCAKKIVFMTGQEPDLKSADHLFEQATLAHPELNLWLQWGELFLRLGWIKKEIALVEKGIEKLTSPNASRYDPLLSGALLGEAFLVLGLFLDDISLIKEGSQRIKEGRTLSKDHQRLFFAASFSSMIEGLYFSDEGLIKEANFGFEKGHSRERRNILLLYALFESCLLLGAITNESGLVRKAILTLKRCIELVPQFYPYYQELGNALLKLHQMEEGENTYLEEAIEQFKIAVSFKEEDTELLYQLGRALDLLGDKKGEESYYEEAIKIFEALLKKEPQAPHIRLQLARTLSHFGELMAHPDSLYEAISYFEGLETLEAENDLFFGEWGYALLNLSELVDEGENFKVQAEQKLMMAAQLGSEEVFYHLACLYALRCEPKLAFDFLHRADCAQRLPSYEDLMHDEWLDSLRNMPEWHAFLLECQEGKNG